MTAPLSRELISERRFRAGYVLRKEKVGLAPSDIPTVMTSAFTPSGDYIGNQKTAYHLCVLKGIKPEKAEASHQVCSIGFCQQDQKWYGWSHRAIFGFGIGSVVEEGDCTASPGSTGDYLREHPEADKSLPIGFEAKTLDDARRMAVAFADSVG